MYNYITSYINLLNKKKFYITKLWIIYTFIHDILYINNYISNFIYNNYYNYVAIVDILTNSTNNWFVHPCSYIIILIVCIYVNYVCMSSCCEYTMHDIRLQIMSFWSLFDVPFELLPYMVYHYPSRSLECVCYTVVLVLYLLVRCILVESVSLVGFCFLD